MMAKFSDEDLLELLNSVSIDSDAEEKPFLMLPEDNGTQMKVLKKYMAKFETRLVAAVEAKDAEIGALMVRLDQMEQELIAQKKLIQELGASDEKWAKPKQETEVEVWASYNKNNQAMANSLKSLASARHAMDQALATLQGQSEPSTHQLKPKFLDVPKPNDLEISAALIANQRMLLRQQQRLALLVGDQIQLYVKKSPSSAAEAVPVATATLANVSGKEQTFVENAFSGLATPNNVKKAGGEAMIIVDNKNEPKNLSEESNLQQEAIEQANQLMASLKGPTSHEYQRHVLDTLKANPTLMTAFVKQRSEKYSQPKQEVTVDNDKSLSGEEPAFIKEDTSFCFATPNDVKKEVGETTHSQAEETFSVATATLTSVSEEGISTGSATPNDGKKEVDEAVAIYENKNEPRNLSLLGAASPQKALKQLQTVLKEAIESPSDEQFQKVLAIVKANPALMDAFVKQRAHKSSQWQKQQQCSMI